MPEPTTALILAAGAGSRLGDLGRRSSKAMIDIAGKPLIAWVIERLRRAGVGRLVIVGHVADHDLAAFAASLGPEARLVRQDQRRGIADALRLALPALSPDESYLACACDSLFAVDDVAGLVALGGAHADAAAVGVLDMGAAATASRSAVRVEGDRVVEIVEKPAPGSFEGGLVAMPLYWLPPDFAPFLAAAPATGEHYVTTALAAFVAAGHSLLAHRVRQRLEITTIDDVARASQLLAG